MEKAPLAAGGLPQNLKARALTMANFEDHARQRRAFAHPFSNTALLGQEPIIQGWIDKLVAALGRFADDDKPANMAAWFTYTIFDIVGDLVFDEPFGCLDSGKGSEWSKNIVNVGTAAAFEQATRRIAGRDTWLQGVMARWFVPATYRAWRTKHFALSAEKTKRRIADKDKEHKDFIYYILKNNESKALLSELEIIMNSALFM
jgi:cytochrome P450